MVLQYLLKCLVLLLKCLKHLSLKKGFTALEMITATEESSAGETSITKTTTSSAEASTITDIYTTSEVSNAAEASTITKISTASEASSVPETSTIIEMSLF